MYFYEKEVTTSTGTQKIIYGPYLLPANAMLKRHHEGKKKLSAADEASLMSAEREMTIFTCPLLEVSHKVEFRFELSTIEYEEMVKIHKSLFTQQEWIDYLGINKITHYNLSTGRKKFSTDVGKRLIDLLLPHSHILEMTAYALSEYVVDGTPVKEMEMSAFGKHSSNLWKTLIDGRNVMFKYYWSQRSHIDLMQIYIYLKTAEYRKAKSEIFTDWYDSPEYMAQSHVQKSTSTKNENSNKSRASHLVKLMKTYKNAELNDHQQKQLNEIIQRGLHALGYVGGELNYEDALKYMEGILGITKERNDFASDQFTNAAAGVMFPVSSESDEDLGIYLMN